MASPIPQVAIRRAVRTDLPPILALYADDNLALRRPEADKSALEEAFGAIESDPRTAIYVATRDGIVVGTFQTTVIHHLLAKVMHVEAVHVHSSERGRGVGTEMMQWALAEARAKGCARVELTSQKRRVDAHRFYERLGFVSAHEGMKVELGPVL